MGQKRGIRRGASSLSLIHEILLIKEMLSSIKFAAIIAIKKAFSLLPHLTSQLMRSPNSGGVDANEAPTPLVPATAINTTPTPTLTAGIGSQSKGLSHVDTPW